MFIYLHTFLSVGSYVPRYPCICLPMYLSIICKRPPRFLARELQATWADKDTTTCTDLVASALEGSSGWKSSPFSSLHVSLFFSLCLLSSQTPSLSAALLALPPSLPQSLSPFLPPIFLCTSFGVFFSLLPSPYLSLSLSLSLSVGFWCLCFPPSLFIASCLDHISDFDYPPSPQTLQAP